MADVDVFGCAGILSKKAKKTGRINMLTRTLSNAIIVHCKTS